ncbi:sugar ABC transporter permease [Caballeronia sp. INDeC2]|uniref:sugar ABC transporter permease n=1 Tax=Caballeronia sp. INDeC2 TaxID=2921747 RepID=UPI002028040A|nr:sugar ABC transporter permease [Caballeronia sp. INDeC2]
MNAQTQTLTAPPTRRELGQLVSARTLSMAVVFVLLAIAFNVASNDIFLTPRNLSLLFRQASIVALVSAGVSILMIMGEIDLSIGSAVYLSGVVAASLSVTHGLGVVPTFAAVLAVGVLMGLWQGFWTVTVGVPSFIVTLAGLLAFRGIGYYTTNAATIAPVSTEFSAISEGFVPVAASIAALLVAWAACAYYILRRHRAQDALGEPQGPSAPAIKLGVLTAIAAFLIWVFSGFRGVPTALLWVAVIGIALWVLMTKTIFGRNAYLTGSNREASILAGIPLARQLYTGFILMGAMYGIAGMLMTARLGASTPTTGMYLELDAIAGAVIGGTALKGGVGTVPGAIIGAVLLATIDNGMSILNVSSFIQLVIKGLVLLFALAFDSYITKRQGRR